MTIGEISNTSGKGDFLFESIRNKCTSSFTSQKNDYQYFHLIDSRNTNQVDANVELSIKLTNIFTEQKTKEPTTRKHKKKVDGEEVTAVSTHYSKSSTLFVEGTYFIKDKKTGVVLNTDHFQTDSHWKHSWASINGNPGAVSKMTKNKAKRNEKPFPELQEMIDEKGGGAMTLAREVTRIIEDFAEDYKK